jgi:hypothetical protein
VLVAYLWLCSSLGVSLTPCERTPCPQPIGFPRCLRTESETALRWKNSVRAIRFTLSEPGFFQRPSYSQVAELCQIPVLRALEQYPIAAVAVAHDGAVLFANTAFVEVLGCSSDAVTSMSYADIFCALPTDETLFAVTRLCPNTLGGSPQSGRATCFVKMRKLAVCNGAASVAISLFEGLMEQLSAARSKGLRYTGAATALHPMERHLRCGAQQCWAAP